MNLGCRYILVNSVHHNTSDFVIASVLVICLYYLYFYITVCSSVGVCLFGLRIYIIR